MGQLLAGMGLQFLGDVHVLGALEDLRIDDIGDDRLVFAGQILVEQPDQLLSRDLSPSSRTDCRP